MRVKAACKGVPRSRATSGRSECHRGCGHGTKLSSQPIADADDVIEDGEISITFDDVAIDDREVVIAWLDLAIAKCELVIIVSGLVIT